MPFLAGMFLLEVETQILQSMVLYNWLLIVSGVLCGPIPILDLVFWVLSFWEMAKGPVSLLFSFD